MTRDRSPSSTSPSPPASAPLPRHRSSLPIPPTPIIRYSYFPAKYYFQAYQGGQRRCGPAPPHASTSDTSHLHISTHPSQHLQTTPWRRGAAPALAQAAWTRGRKMQTLPRMGGAGRRGRGFDDSRTLRCGRRGCRCRLGDRKISGRRRTRLLDTDTDTMRATVGASVEEGPRASASVFVFVFTPAPRRRVGQCRPEVRRIGSLARACLT
jgi:hypothetical protein